MTIDISVNEFLDMCSYNDIVDIFNHIMDDYPEIWDNFGGGGMNDKIFREGLMGLAEKRLLMSKEDTEIIEGIIRKY